MKTTTITLRALQDIMTFCPDAAGEAAAAYILFQTDPGAAQRQAKDLAVRIISSGAVGTMPPERIKDIAIWAAQGPTIVTDSARTVLQVRLTPSEKAMVQELADAYTDGNMSKVIMTALKSLAGIDI